MAPTFVVKRKFDWIIKNVTKEKVANPQFIAESETFFINLPHVKTEWKIYTKHEDRETDSISFFLSLVNFKEAGAGLNVNLSIAKPRDAFSKKWNDELDDFGWDRFLEVNELFDPSFNYIDDNLNWKLDFEIELSYSYTNFDAIFGAKFFNDTDFADFVLTSSDGEDIKVHSIILANRSKYFTKMFTIDMKEKRSKSVTYEDINSTTLKEVLKFIYKGKFEVTDIDAVKNVLYAAEKFEIYGLIVLCCDKLVKKVKKENVLEMLETAEMVRSEKLEEKCLEIIVNNYNEFEKHITDVARSKKTNRAFATARGMPHFTLQSIL